MTSAPRDMLNAARSSLAMKAPCRVATTEAITLAGEQTIDGVAAVSGDRILVKDQASNENGIYVCDTGEWTRAPDCNGGRDITQGTLVVVNDGASNGAQMYEVVTDNPITVGETTIEFELFASNLTENYSLDFVTYDEAPTLPDSGFTATLPGGVASIGGARREFAALEITMAASKMRRYYIGPDAVVSYDEDDVLNYSIMPRRQPGKVFLYQVTSSATTVDSILPMSNTFPVKRQDDMIIGSIDYLVEVFYLYDTTTAWSAALAASTYGQLLLTSAGKVYQVVIPGVTGSVAPTALTDYDLDGNPTGYVVDGTCTLAYYCTEGYLGAFRYAKNNGIEWYFVQLGLAELVHMVLRSGSPLGPAAGTTMASLIKKHLQIQFKHVITDFYSGGTYARGMKMICDGWIWECTTAGAVAAATTAFTTAAPHSLGQTVHSGTSDWIAIYEYFGAAKFFWLNVDQTFTVYRYPDSHDSYASTFFSLIARYLEHTGDYAWLLTSPSYPGMATYKAMLDLIIYYNLDTQLENFLSRSFQGNIAPWDGSVFSTQYFEDNCETVRGYLDASYVYGILGDTTQAATDAANATYVSVNGLRPMYNTTYNLVAWYYGNDVSTWAERDDLQFYPYIQAQFYAEKCQLPTFIEDQYYEMRQSVFRLYSNWITDRGKDSFPNCFLGLIAARTWGDPYLAYSFIEQAERYHLKDGRLILSEFACYLRIKELLVPKKSILAASDDEIEIKDEANNVYHLVRNGRTVKAMADADQTLVAPEYRNPYIECTGPLTVKRNLVVPLTARQWTVFANTTGGVGIQVIGVTGTGVSIADGKRAIVQADGTNVVRVTPDT